MYLAPLPFELLPWSFSSVSLTCFWTSSALGSSLVEVVFFGLKLDFWAVLWPGFWEVFALSLGLLILLLFLFEFDEDGLSFFFSDLNFDKSIVSPVDLSPDNFLYLVVTVSDSSLISWLPTLTSLLTTSSVVAIDFSESIITSFGVFSFVTVFLISLGEDSTESLLFTALFFAKLGWRSIFPTFFTSFNFEAAVMTLASSSFFFNKSSISASLLILRASFSLDLASPNSFEATFLFASVWNSSDKSS